MGVKRAEDTWLKPGDLKAPSEPEDVRVCGKENSWCQDLLLLLLLFPGLAKSDIYLSSFGKLFPACGRILAKQIGVVHQGGGHL